MPHRTALSLCLALAAACVTTACEDASRSGNNLTCHSGGCSSSCDYVGSTTPCNVVCEAGSTCDARCNPGQQCNLDCMGNAECTFNCSEGSCNATGGPTCACSGNCTGTCDMSVMDPGDAGPGGPSCIDQCGDPNGPGYAACVAACG